MDEAHARRKRAVDAGAQVARRLGLQIQHARVLKDSNNTIVLLEPAGLIAKVGTAPRADAHHVLAHELAIGRYLAKRNAPIAPPADEVAPGPHLTDGLTITLWRYIRSSDEADVSDADLGRMLRNFHDAFAAYPRQLPDFMDNLRRAHSALEDVNRTPALTDTDRAFLLEVVGALSDELPADLPRHALHGDPHLEGNVLMSHSGPLLVDFEAACVGPYEWDLTSLQRASGAYPSMERGVMPLLSRMRSLTVTTWCWLQYGRAPEVDEAAHVHLSLLRKTAARGGASSS